MGEGERPFGAVANGCVIGLGLWEIRRRCHRRLYTGWMAKGVGFPPHSHWRVLVAVVVALFEVIGEIGACDV